MSQFHYYEREVLEALYFILFAIRIKIINNPNFLYKLYKILKISLKILLCVS